MGQAYNPSTHQVEAERSRIQGQSVLHEKNKTMASTYISCMYSIILFQYKDLFSLCIDFIVVALNLELPYP